MTLEPSADRRTAVQMLAPPALQLQRRRHGQAQEHAAAAGQA